jgi:hypothetical protein
MALEESATRHTPESIAVEYARKHEGENSAEALRDKFQKEAEQEATKKTVKVVGVGILVFLGWLLGTIFN